MKIALSWLKRYIDLSGYEENLAELLTFAGIEVEGIEQLKSFGPSLIAARVVSAEPVPKTDHLKVCRIDIGNIPYEEKDEDGLIQLICGAPNCRAGMMAALAMPGTDLGEFKIGKAKIRGVLSHGMLCSEKELGLSDNHAGIIELPQDTVIGTLIDELYNLPDTIFELEITPNRSDLLGYLGIAKDLAAKLSLKLIEPKPIPFPKASGQIELKLTNEEPKLCPRYTLQLIEGVQIASSPLWLAGSLIKSGLRPINNIVDITNYVMLEMGHPLHAFDYDKLLAKDEAEGYPDIIVRKCLPKEEFIALDGKAYTMDGDELAIADGKRISALAGVMGSDGSAIAESTVNIALESAAFNPASVRRTSYKHKISTDSSYRFERHLSPEYAEKVSQRATGLILELAGGKLSGSLKDSYPMKQEEKVMGIRPSRFKLLIGYEMAEDKLRDILEKLGFEYLKSGKYQKGELKDIKDIEACSKEDKDYALYFIVPANRLDISREADILEELSRLDGYDKVPQKLVVQDIMDRFAYDTERTLSDWMVGWGAYETLNYSFTDPLQMQALGYEDTDHSFIRLINPQSSNQSVMRVSLIPQLLTNLAYNLNHGHKDIRLFELGRIYYKDGSSHREPKRLAGIFTGKDSATHYLSKPKQLSYAWVKGCFEGLLDSFGISKEIRPSDRPYLVPSESFAYYDKGREIGYFGRLKPPVLEKWDIDVQYLKQEVWVMDYDVKALVELKRERQISYQPISRFPAVSRDLSFLVSSAVSYQELKELILSLDTKLIKEVEIFDEYRSEQIAAGQKSLSLHIVLQDEEKTLTDQGIDQLMALVQKALTDRYNIAMR